MVMIEALACGTPIVANDRGSVSEIVDDGETGLRLSTTSRRSTRALHRVGGLDRSHCRAVAEQTVLMPAGWWRTTSAVYRTTIERLRDCPDTARPPAARATTGVQSAPRGHRSARRSKSALPTERLPGMVWIDRASRLSFLRSFLPLCRPAPRAVAPSVHRKVAVR